MKRNDKEKLMEELIREIYKFSYENTEGMQVVYCGDLEPILKKYTNKVIRAEKRGQNE